MRKMLRSKIDIELDLKVIGEVSEGITAIEKALIEPPDLIIFDYDTPDMDGLEFTRQVNQLKPDVPIIVISFSDDEELRSLAITAGAADFITKEVNTDAFMAAIHRVVKNNPE